MARSPALCLDRGMGLKFETVMIQRKPPNRDDSLEGRAQTALLRGSTGQFNPHSPPRQAHPSPVERGPGVRQACPAPAVR
ncbi:MAG: hypothetical protein J0L67_00590 [Cytophagales bacterium]|nr:hypothetical protein [Cytophagales bacterium]